MLRIITYSAIGFLLGVVFGPPFTMSNVVVLSMAVGGAVAGAALGIYLNRVIAPQHHFDIDNLLWHENRSFPWALIPRPLRYKMFTWVRSKFKRQDPQGVGTQQAVDWSFLDDTKPPAATSSW